VPPGEVPGLAPLLANLDLAGAVVTADALQTHRDTAGLLVSAKQPDRLFTVKANQPVLLARCARLAWQRVPVLDRTRGRAPGRVERRTLKAVTVGTSASARRAGRPGHRKTRDLRTRRWRTVVVDVVTSPTHAQANPPGWPTSCVGPGRPRTACTGCGM
jgi:hypothetical protein